MIYRGALTRACKAEAGLVALLPTTLASLQRLAEMQIP